MFVALDDAVGAAIDVIVLDVTQSPGSDAILCNVDTSDKLLLLLALFFFLFCIRFLCLMPSPLLLFEEKDKIVHVEVRPTCPKGGAKCACRGRQFLSMRW